MQSDKPNPERVVLPVTVVNKVLDYLATKPYNDVYAIIQSIHNSAELYEQQKEEPKE